MIKDYWTAISGVNLSSLVFISTSGAANLVFSLGGGYVSNRDVS